MQMTENQLIYLYCITNEEPMLKNAEDLVEGLYFVHNKGLYAVVRNVEENEFGQKGLKRNMADFEWVKAEASVHERIIELVMADTDVIPFKFGTLFNTNDSLKAMFAEYGEQIRSEVADIKNVGDGRWGGAITAAKFLEEFVAEKPWVHLDIAGPAFLDSSKPWIDAGGSGFGVRTLVEVARGMR